MSTTAPTKKISFKFPRGRKFREERQHVFESFAMLLSSGTDLLTTISVIREEMETKHMKDVLGMVSTEINNGARLSHALENAGLINEREFALLEIGEGSGHLSDHLDLIAKQEEREQQFVSRIRSATLYPIIVLSVALVLGLGISWFILPKLAGVFTSLHLELPLATRIIVWVGKFLQEYGIIVVPLFLLFFFLGLYVVFVFKRTRHIGQWLLLRTPGIRRLIQESEVAKFGYLFGTLLSAGIPIVNAIESLEDATVIRVYKRLYRHLADQISEGHSVGNSFRSYPHSSALIPLSTQHTIAAAAESGKLATTLLGVGERYGAKVEITTKDLGTLLEPLMIVLIWLVVVFMAFAVISPIYGLLQGIQ